MNQTDFIQRLHRDPSFVPLNFEFVSSFAKGCPTYSILLPQNNTHYIFASQLAEQMLSSTLLLPNIGDILFDIPPEIASLIKNFPVFSSVEIHRKFRGFIGKNYLKQSHLYCGSIASQYIQDSLCLLKSGDSLSNNLSDLTMKINSKILHLSDPVEKIFSKLTPQFAAAFKTFPFDFTQISIDLVDELYKVCLDDDPNIDVETAKQSIESLFFIFFSGSDTIISLFEVYLYLRSNQQLYPHFSSMDSGRKADYILAYFPYFRFIARVSTSDLNFDDFTVRSGDTVMISIQAINCLMGVSKHRTFTFGFGEYSCIGKFVSPVVLSVFIDIVESDFKLLKLDCKGFAPHPILTYLDNPQVII
ncbi:hypothetical protein SynBIOSE41_02089 [Synechococcus sp. BIOS-E4-1]|uniref:hypothetical protein n=1 Tax=Synechococcus sp. BIOS-E4-1 TaxID=1400864 RepID=UPI0016480AA1|nr:hypothetical protein [Synechococcus sp. BIOS-E4-1]QNI54594.1 hypothetical protein SynBIOSE41_02089 [Synechococcus sp. BIOS-E4-1]